jgi:hypothetical protein
MAQPTAKAAEVPASARQPPPDAARAPPPPADARGAFGVVVRHTEEELVLRHADFPELVRKPCTLMRDALPAC